MRFGRNISLSDINTIHYTRTEDWHQILTGPPGVTTRPLCTARTRPPAGCLCCCRWRPPLWSSSCAEAQTWGGRPGDQSRWSSRWRTRPGRPWAGTALRWGSAPVPGETSPRRNRDWGRQIQPGRGNNIACQLYSGDWRQLLTVNKWSRPASLFYFIKIIWTIENIID